MHSFAHADIRLWRKTLNRVFFTAQCVKETYSGSSKTLDERLNLQHGKTKEHMDTDDQQI